MIASHVYDQLPLLTRVNGQLQGKSFDRAEARFELTAAIQENGQVQLVASPELQYGNAQLKFVGGDGVLRPEPSRPTRVFDELKTAALLNPGQMLILSSLADCPGSVGHYFFTQPIGDNLAQKFIIIRLANIGPKPLFDDEVEPPQSAISEAAPDESASPR